MPDTTRSSGETPLFEGNPSVRKSNAKKLASGYTKKKRFMECCYLSLATYLWFSHLFIVVRYFVHNRDADVTQLVWTPFMVLLAMSLADFISGIVHWGFDTWGTPETLFFGNFIRSFREHHVNQTAMTKHDFIETNADTTLPLLPFLLIQRYCLFSTNENNVNGYNIHNDNVGGHVFIITLFLLITLTNEIHKWVHEAKPHFLARTLIRFKLILTPGVHRLHHKGNYDSNYCITTGWMNMPLEKVNFWRRAEAVITNLTGAIPRANDQIMLGK